MGSQSWPQLSDSHFPDLLTEIVDGFAPLVVEPSCKFSEWLTYSLCCVFTLTNEIFLFVAFTICMWPFLST